MRLISDGIYRFGSFEMHPARRCLRRDGQPVALPPKAFDLLAYLVANPGRPIEKDELLNEVWHGAFVEESNLARQISLLRKALAPQGDVIATIPARGYQFVAEVALAEPAQEMVTVQHTREQTHIVVEETAELPAAARRIHWKAAAAVAAAVLTAVAGAGIWHWTHRPRPVVREVMLAHFQNQTGEAVFDSSLESALRISLEQTPYIDLLSRNQIAATLKTMQKPEGVQLTGEVAREVCLRNNYQVVVSGAITRVDSQYLIELEAANCTTGASVAAEKVHLDDENSALDALDKLARALRRDLGESRRQVLEHQAPIKNATTSSLEALEDYSQGTLLLNHGNIQAAIALYQKAVAIDPRFATAWRALGIAYGVRSDDGKQAEYCRRAYDLRDRATDLERANIEISYWTNVVKDLRQAIAAGEAAVSIYPQNVTLLSNLCNAYIAVGQNSEALGSCERAYHLSPTGTIAWRLAVVYRKLGRIADAKQVATKAAKANPNVFWLQDFLFRIAWLEHDSQGIKQYQQWSAAHPQEVRALDSLGRAAASMGKLREMDNDFALGRSVAERNSDAEMTNVLLLDEAEDLSALGKQAAALHLLKQVDKSIYQEQFLMVLADAGDTSAARAYLASPSAQPNHGTAHDEFEMSILRAQVALADNRPEEALQNLEPARSQQWRDFSVLMLRAEAEAKAGRFEAAEADYRFILANPGIDPIDIAYFIAHLELAHLLVKEGKMEPAHAEYRAFLDGMKSADSGIPIIAKARNELAALH